jgi:hypothetical protein
MLCLYGVIHSHNDSNNKARTMPRWKRGGGNKEGKQRKGASYEEEQVTRIRA